jgi:hypothetical protein
MEEIITAQSQALDNIEPQTQAANATNAKVIKIKKEVEQAQDNLIQAQQSVATHAWSIISHNFWITVIINIDSAFVAYDINKMFKPCFHFLN